MSSHFLNSLNAWSRSIFARIEGRNIVIVVLLAFAAFAVKILLEDYERHPLLTSFGLLSMFFLVSFVAIAGLLLKPQPSEISTRFLLEQRGRDLVAAGGLQSIEEITQVLRLAHNIQDLPPPVALVDGSASNQNDYRPLTPGEALKLAEQDHHDIEQLLKAHLSALLSKDLPGGPQRDLTSPKQEHSTQTSATKPDDPGPKAPPQ